MTSMNGGGCGCGCSPCVCTTSTTVGCVPDLCVPRPCFFNGQLISADDLNAVVAYFRTKEAMLARFVGGWGVLGGLKLGASPGALTQSLLAGYFARTISPNPQIMVGTVAQISPGAGIDAAGRTMTLCEPRTVDLTSLIAQPAAPTTQPCNSWFQGLSMRQCSPAYYAEDGGNPKEAYPSLTATAYWLVAQFVETPARPAPQYSGGGPCDPAPSCNYSRRIEDIKLSLVPALPKYYFLTGCLDPLGIELFEGELFEGPDGAVPCPIPVNDGGGGTAFNQGFVAGSAQASIRTGALTEGRNAFECMYFDYAVMDAINGQLAAACCTTPALVLGQVIFTSNAGVFQGNLPNAPMYTILLDAYPFRRVIASAALDWFAIVESMCSNQYQYGARTTETVASAGPAASGVAPAVTGAAAATAPPNPAAAQPAKKPKS